jgi:beta-N-acetylhexosaminidase
MAVQSVTACLVLAAATAAACTSAVPGHGTHQPRHRHRTASQSHSLTGPPTRTENPAPSTPTTDASTTSDAPIPSAESAQQVLARMTLAERVGQLLMVDCPSTEVAPPTVTAIRSYHVGSVILDGTTQQGVAATAAVTRELGHLAPRHVGLFIATDQEGGLVQRLQGPGFSPMPSAVEQGRWTPQHLQHEATLWGEQLRAAGVNVNLAPVLDTVPAGFGSNPPIGDLDREYGHRPVRVRVHGLAFAAGMQAAGVDATGKHFPGLGRVHGNTDTTSGVTDTVTTRHDPYLRPFAAAAQARIPFLMVSTAIYARIDPGVPAAFSRTIVTGMLRGDLGYRGVIISDDLGAAAQVRDVPVGRRAVRFVRAGGDVVLTVDAAQARTMTHALLARARNSPAFKQRVDAAALTVLRAKRAAGLLR